MPIKVLPEYPKSKQPPKTIISTDGSKVLVDSEDYPVLSRHSWYIIGHSNGMLYATTKMKTDMTGIKRCLFMHHLILGSSAITDHEDRNTLNNQKHNLRPATRCENEWNKAKQKTARGKPCTSQYKGVSFDHRVGKYKAQIKRNGVHYDLGYHANEVDAARAYNAKVIELSGKFAWVNPLPDINQDVTSRT